MYKAYFFGNYYLSDVQQGVQGMHVTSGYAKKYVFSEPVGEQFDNALNVFKEWACNDHVVVLLNGGNSESLSGLINMFDTKENPFPWMFFNEDNASLNGALTSVGIILPRCLSNARPEVKEELFNLTNFVNKKGHVQKKHWENVSTETKEVLKECPNVAYAYQLMVTTQSCRLVG